MRTIFTILFLVIGITEPALAQDDNRQKARKALQDLTQKYQQSKLLSFDIQYTYATEDKPGQPMDSLQGQCRLDGTRYWSLLDQTESMYNNDMIVMLFPQDSLIYLGKSTAMQATGSPVAVLDSFFLQHGDMQFDYSENKDEISVSMTLPPGGPSQKTTLYISRKTGYLTRMSSLVRSDQMYEPSVRSLVSNAAAVYVIVETQYTNYRQGAFDETIFNAGRYVQKQGNDYIAVAPYNTYKVFLGSPEL